MHRVLSGIIDHGRIASAYLLVGAPDSDKRSDAESFAERLGSRGTDKIVVEPKGASLKIDQIREIQQVVRYGPAHSPYLCVIVERADEMTEEAAGAFLKTLEEPPPGVVFILLIEREGRLPETIKSRCQKIIFEERQKGWEAKAEYSSFYEELKNYRQKNIIEQLDFSGRLEKEKERIEELLYDLVRFSEQELSNIKMARLLLETVKKLKKKANLKLALDVAALSLGEI
jgi:DNA polymerase III delta prime subunit